MLTFLLRGSLVTLNTDLTKIPSDMPAVAPHYFLNVPQLLERMRRGVDEQVAQKGGVAHAIYSRAKAAWMRRKEQNVKPGIRSGCGSPILWFSRQSARKWWAKI